MSAPRVGMTDIAANLSARTDQSVNELNSKLPEVIDKALGFGFLEGYVKGQLVKLRDPVRFCTHLSTDSSFDSVESTSSSKASATLTQTIQINILEGDYGVESNYSSRKQAAREQREVCFFFKRVIAKRSIPVPKFSDLIPVRKQNHVEDGR